MNKINFDSLEKAILQLEAGIFQAQQHVQDELMRDGVIQRFEYTMDLAWKMLQRFLKVELQVEEYALRSKKDIFREAARLQIIDDAESWINYYEARNETSHDYDTVKAQNVYAQVLLFLPDVKKLLVKLNAH